MDIGQHHGSVTARWIWIIGSPLVFIVGVIGNFVTILILSNRSQKKSSTTVYLTVLAVADLCVMVISLPRWWIIYVFEVDIRHLGKAVCKTQWFLTYFSGGVSTAVLTTVTIEKIICSLKPYKVKRCCTVKNARIICSVIVLLLVAIYGHVLYGMTLYDKEIYRPINQVNDSLRKESVILDSSSNYSVVNLSFELKTDNNKTITNESLLNSRNGSEHLTFIKSKVCWFEGEEYGRFYSGAFQILNVFFYNIVTEMTSFIGGFIIIRKLTVGRKFRTRNSKNKLEEAEFNAMMPMFEIHSRQITISLLLVNIVFVVCTTPVFVFLIGRSVWVDSEKGMTETQEITWAVLNLMFYTNHAVNFVLYFLSAARFRKKAMSIFLCRGGNYINSMSLSQAASVGGSEGHPQNTFELREQNAMKKHSSIEVFQSYFQPNCSQEIENCFQESLSERVNHERCDMLCNLRHDADTNLLSEGSHQNLHILLELRRCGEDPRDSSELPVTINLSSTCAFKEQNFL